MCREIAGNIAGLSRPPAGKALLCKLGEIFVPIFLSIATEFEKIFPTKNPGRVHVIKGKPHRIIANRMQFEDLHILLAADRTSFAWRMSLNLGARTAHAKIFGGKIEAVAVVESHCEDLAILV
jgi:hypothetical protein